ncbi:MAG: hypothetical protein DRI61_16045 [Chloroflexi bacterium]|nr:MAG: hypothetical protein DRI61_16045 [Chloroflexota bacterium]HDN79337.1 hypothetical protein [Chloroflexota bacterium]
MGGIITGVKAQGKSGKKLAIYVDGRYAFSLPMAEAVHLYEGQHLSDEELEKLEAKAQFYKAYEAALHLLKYRPRSEYEVRSHLRRKRIPAGVIEGVLERLREEGILDDGAFARFWVENRREFKPSGVWKLRYELRQKGVSEEIITEVLAGIDFEEEAYKAALKRAPRLRDLPWPDFQKKMGDFLARRGFSYELIENVVIRVWREMHPSAEIDDATIPD